MTLHIRLHPDNPQPRLLEQAAELLNTAGQLLAVPTETSYVLIAKLDDKKAVESLRQLRGIDDKHLLTVMCRDLSELGTMSKVNNQQYRLLKLATPGPWTFILPASQDIPRRIAHPSRKTIGLRIPEHPVIQQLLAVIDEPVLSCSYIPKDGGEAFNDADSILEHPSQHALAAVLDAGACQNSKTTIIDLSGPSPEVIRLGLGDPSTLGLD